MPKHKQKDQEQGLYRQSLEQLVAERTDELNAANEELRRQIGERIKAEEILRVSEMKHRAIFENAPLGIGLATFDGHIIQFNQFNDPCHKYA